MELYNLKLEEYGPTSRLTDMTNDEEDEADRDVVRGLNRYQSRKGYN